MATSTRLARNGIRQAHALNAASFASAIAVIAPVPSSSPIGTPACGRLAIRPRRRCLPHSIDSSTDPLHSPPTAIPWNTRSTTSRIGAAMPIDRRARKHANQGAGDPHHEQRHDQRGLAAQPVAPVPEDRRAHRPGREPHRVGSEGLQGPGVGAGIGEEDGREHDRRGRPVQEEVVPLDRGADHAGDGGEGHLPPVHRVTPRNRGLGFWDAAPSGSFPTVPRPVCTGPRPLRIRAISLLPQ